MSKARKLSMLYRFSQLASFLIFKYFFSLEVKGKEAIPKKGSFILAANHLSNLDPPLLAAACFRRIGFAAKKELFCHKIFALYLNAVGAIPVERGKISLRTLRCLLNSLKKRPLLIFPEGSRGLGLEKVGSGVGFLRKKSKVPVVVAKISGTNQVLPRGRVFPKKVKIKVTFMPAKGINDFDSSKQIAAKIADSIRLCR